MMYFHSPAANLLRTLIIMFLLNEKLIAFSAFSKIQSTNHDKYTRSDLTYSNRRLKKNNENLCPDEYKSCWCDYTNTNLNLNNNKNTNNINNNINNNSKFNPKSSVSIMIDCQYYFSTGESDDFKAKTPSQNSSSAKNKLTKKIQTSLFTIPKISNNNSIAKFKYLKQISHIDLSRTDITEIHTDAFHGLTGLQTIVITYCKNLARVRMFAFRHLPNLKTLIIANNPNLIELEPHAFGSLRNLNYLSLSMNQLNVIDGYIFSSSTSIKTIDFIGNPIKRIKSFAFHGLKNVSDLLLSLNQNVTPIEMIEGDSFISTAFVEQIFLEGIPTKTLTTNAFRGLSYCKTLHLSNTHIEEIEANVFFRANHIDKLNLQNSRIRSLNKDAFSGMYIVDIIDLRGNYISKLARNTFEPLIQSNINLTKENVINPTSSIRVIEKNDKYLVAKILFEQNPIQCDCSLDWIIRNKLYSNFIGLPEICAGPKGYDCLRISELTMENLACIYNVSVVKPPSCIEMKFPNENKQSNLNIPDSEENIDDLDDDDSYDAEYFASSNKAAEVTITQVITPVHIIDMVTVGPLENNNMQAKKATQNYLSKQPKASLSLQRTDVSTRQISTTDRQTINKLSVITTLKQAQFNKLDANQKNNQLNERLNDNVIRFDNRSISSLTNLANTVVSYKNFKFFLYLYSINLTLVCYISNSFSANLYINI